MSKKNKTIPLIHPIETLDGKNIDVLVLKRPSIRIQGRMADLSEAIEGKGSSMEERLDAIAECLGMICVNVTKDDILDCMDPEDLEPCFEAVLDFF